MKKEKPLKRRKIFGITLGDLRGLKEVDYLSEKGLKFLEEMENDDEEELKK